MPSITPPEETSTEQRLKTLNTLSLLQIFLLIFIGINLFSTKHKVEKLMKESADIKSELGHRSIADVGFTNYTFDENHMPPNPITGEYNTSIHVLYSSSTIAECEKSVTGAFFIGGGSGEEKPKICLHGYYISIEEAVQLLIDQSGVRYEPEQTETKEKIPAKFVK